MHLRGACSISQSANNSSSFVILAVSYCCLQDKTQAKIESAVIIKMLLLFLQDAGILLGIVST